jgi:hypothetical protein
MIKPAPCSYRNVVEEASETFNCAKFDDYKDEELHREKFFRIKPKNLVLSLTPIASSS